MNEERRFMERAIDYKLESIQKNKLSCIEAKKMLMLQIDTYCNSKMKEIYIIFQERELSCDPDYDYDGFIVVWDCGEIGRNLTTCELIEKIGEYDKEIYQKVINYLYRDKELSYGEHDKDINDMYFDDVFEFIEKEIGGGAFYKYNYQSVSTFHSVYSNEQGAKNTVKYLNEKSIIPNRYSYTTVSVNGEK